MGLTIDEIKIRKAVLDAEVLKMFKAFEKETGAEVRNVIIERPLRGVRQELPITSLIVDVAVSI